LHDISCKPFFDLRVRADAGQMKLQKQLRFVGRFHLFLLSIRQLGPKLFLTCCLICGTESPKLTLEFGVDRRESCAPPGEYLQQIEVKVYNFNWIYGLTKSVLSLIKGHVRVENEWQTEKIFMVRTRAAYFWCVR